MLYYKTVLYVCNVIYFVCDQLKNEIDRRNQAVESAEAALMEMKQEILVKDATYLGVKQVNTCRVSEMPMGFSLKKCDMILLTSQSLTLAEKPIKSQGRGYGNMKPVRAY